jgi:hypothetical protein
MSHKDEDTVDANAEVNALIYLISKFPSETQKAAFEKMASQGVFAGHGFKLIRLIKRGEEPAGTFAVFPVVPLPIAATATDKDSAAEPIDAFPPGESFYIRVVTDARTGKPIGVAAASPEELEAMTAGVRVGHKVGYDARTPKARKTDRNREIVRLHGEENVTFPNIPKRLQEIDARWVRSDGTPMKWKTVRRLYYRTKKKNSEQG